MGCSRESIQFLLTQVINLQWSISKIDSKLFWIVISKTHIISEDINVVGNKESSCTENQGLQHEGMSKDGNTYAFKCKYLKLSFLMCLV